SVAGLVSAGLLEARAGKVRLLRREELPEDWDPTKDHRLTVWETAQHLIRAHDQHGEEGAAAMLHRDGPTGEIARDLAFQLYSICDRKGWAQEAMPYNSLSAAWSAISELAAKAQPGEQLGMVFGG